VLTAGKVVVAELAARERIRFTVWLSAVSIVINIIANFVLIPSMGISGAALASTISYSVVSVVVLRYYLRETRLPWSVLVPRWSDLSAYAALSRRLGGRGLVTGA
jgi:O-antigen/teichoic acid export membrane protein